MTWCDIFARKHVMARRPMPARRLFGDISNTESQKSVEVLAKQLSSLSCSAFENKYSFSLTSMAPLGTEPQLRHSWSWESVEARHAPRFYHKRVYYPASHSAITTPSTEELNSPTETGRRGSLKDSSVKDYFRHVRRSFSLENVSRTSPLTPEINQSTSRNPVKGQSTLVRTKLKMD